MMANPLLTPLIPWFSRTPSLHFLCSVLIQLAGASDPHKISAGLCLIPSMVNYSKFIRLETSPPPNSSLTTSLRALVHFPSQFPPSTHGPAGIRCQSSIENLCLQYWAGNVSTSMFWRGMTPPGAASSWGQLCWDRFGRLRAQRGLVFIIIILIIVTLGQVSPAPPGVSLTDRVI